MINEKEGKIDLNLNGLRFCGFADRFLPTVPQVVRIFWNLKRFEVRTGMEPVTDDFGFKTIFRQFGTNSVSSNPPRCHYYSYI